jgi:hypothetical protein
MEREVVEQAVEAIRQAGERVSTEPRPVLADSAAEQEALRRAEGLVSKSAGDLGMREALSKVFAEDAELYRRYTAEKRAPEDTAPEPPARGHMAELTKEVMALAKMFTPSDAEGLGLLKVRDCVAEVHKLMLRKKGVAI